VLGVECYGRYAAVKINGQWSLASERKKGARDQEVGTSEKEFGMKSRKPPLRGSTGSPWQLRMAKPQTAGQRVEKKCYVLCEESA
jgi:hypothetical protein